MDEPTKRIPEFFGCMVFNEDKMRQRLSADAYEAWQQCMTHGTPLPRSIADQIAAAMKDANNDIENRPDENICYVTISCKTAVDSGKLSDIMQGLLPADGMILDCYEVRYDDGASAFDVIAAAAKENKIHMEYKGGKSLPYIEGAENLYEFDCGPESGWMYKVNGWFPNYGCSRYQLKEGDTISVLNGITICEKYVPAVKRASGSGGGGNHVRKRSDPISPLFQEHADTEQLAYNLSAFHAGDLVEVTLKMHGTSQRTGYLPVLQGYKYRNRMEKRLYESRKTPNVIRSKIKRAPIYDWGYVTGTRRVVLDTFDEGGFYGNNAFREKHANVFEGKLHKGETVYYEVVGFTDDGTPIMNPGNNSKLNDKEFTKQYGKTTTFSYGCAPDGKEHPKSNLFVYRMTMTNEDGDVVEYPPDFMRYRCEQMGLKYVPLMYRGLIPEEEIFTGTSCELTNAGEWIKTKAEQYYDGPDPVGHTHVREGVVCRIVNRPKFAAYKHKNFAFKALEGLIKDTAAAPDMEEAQDVGEQNG